MGLAGMILLLLVGARPSLGAATQEPPVFRTTVDLVAIDVTVVDGSGRPVSDLRPEDFEVLVDGRARRIVGTQFLRHALDLPVVPAASGLKVASTPRPHSSNTDGPPGRLIALVPDVGNLSAAGARGAAEAARRFLDRLTSADRVALVTIPVGPRVDFTSDHAKLREALGKVTGGNLDRLRGMRYVSLAEAFAFKSRGDQRLWNSAVGRECYGARTEQERVACRAEMENEAIQIHYTAKATTATSVGALRGLMRALARVEGPKTVVLLSQGLVTGGSMGQLGADRELAPVADDAAGARVTLYTILIDNAFLEQIQASERWQPATQTQDRRLLADGLEAVTGYAGGQLHRVMVLADPGFDRIASETSGSWLLSIEPEAGDRDGKPHALRVKVARDSLTVRSRPQFVAGAATPPASPRELARRALDAPISAAGIPIAITTYVLGDRGGSDPELVVAAELEVEPTTPGLELVWRVLDDAGQVVGGEVAQGQLNSVQAASGRRCAYYSASLPVKPGPHTVSLAAADAGGRVGSVQHRVLARFHPAGALALSDLMIAEPSRRAGQRVALNVNGTLAGRTLTAYLEVRATEPLAGAAPAVRFEVVSLTPGETEAPPVVVREAEVRAESVDGRWNAEASLDLEALPAGDYLVRALAYNQGQAAGSVTRPLRLSPRP